MENCETTKVLKIPGKYTCEKCNYTTSNKSNLNKHFRTKRHKYSTFETNVKQQKVLTKTFVCEYCNLTFNSRTSIWRHKIKCAILNLINEHEVLKEKNEVLVSKIIDKNTQPQVINNNNTFNLQIFLNNNCKNAMNIGDFIKSLNITMEDLNYSRLNGKIEGVSKILIKGLNNLEETNRPVHCTDESNNILFIKDNDKWDKDVDNNILEESITKVEKAEQKILASTWEESHPNWMEDEDLQQEYLDIVKNTMTLMSSTEKKKVIGNVAKIVKLKEKTS